MWQASLPVNFCNFWMGKWKCLSVVSWLFATPWTVAHQVPLVWGILQARILEWLAIPFSRGSSRPRDQTWVSCITGKFFTWMRKASENKTLLNDTVFAARNFLYRNTCKMSNRVFCSECSHAQPEQLRFTLLWPGACLHLCGQVLFFLPFCLCSHFCKLKSVPS